jgi:undecaprenyl-diphosphatase
LALVPGVSRSGIIITGARFLKFNRIDSAKISFLLSIPALGGWSLYGFYDLIKQNDGWLNTGAILTAFLSFIFSYLTIKYFLVYLKKFNLSLFVGYRLILGIILLLVAYL